MQGRVFYRSSVENRSSSIMPILACKSCTTSKAIPRHTDSHIRKNREGFTVLELLVVVLILGVLATVAIMAMLSFKEKGGVATLKSDLKSAYKTSLQYYMDAPSGTITLDILESYGYRPSKNVALDVVDGNHASLNITAVHSGVAGVYQIDQDGNVSKQ